MSTHLLVTDPIHRKRIMRWVEALESGDYEQCNSKLRDEYRGLDKDSEPQYSYCCLGVACDRYVIETGDASWEGTSDFYANPKDGSDGEFQSTVLPAEVAKWLFGDSQRYDPDLVSGTAPESGLPFRHDCATELNDETGLDFKEIAALVRREILGEEVPLPHKLIAEAEAWAELNEFN